jgi:hypothetical protein
MMIQTFSEYNRYVEAGRAKALTCPMHEDDIFPLTTYLTANERIGLKCFACGYNQVVGQDYYNKIKVLVENLTINDYLEQVNEPEKMDNE